MELLIGCGNRRDKRLCLPGEAFEWSHLVTMDHDPNCGSDVVGDLEEPWPFEVDSFDEVHAYEVLEHLGRQGDYKAFFRDFGEIYRVLKPGGHLFATCPSWKSSWCWGDPSHTRAMQPHHLFFLDQTEYTDQVGKTYMTDFRWLWKGDFERVGCVDNGEEFKFVLKAHKPARV